MAVNTSKVTSAANDGNVEISPHGTGKVRLPQNAGFQSNIISTDTNGDVKTFRVNDLPGAPFPDFPAGTDLIICDRITDNQVRQVTVDKLATSVGSILGGAVTVQPGVPPTPAVKGDLWYNTAAEDARLYVYFGPDSGGTSQWVEVTPSAPLGQTGATEMNFPAGAAGATYDAPNGVSYVWNSTYTTWQGEIGGSAVNTGTTAPNSGDPTKNNAGDLWYNTSIEDSRLYVWYEESNYNAGLGPGRAQWVDTTPSAPLTQTGVVELAFPAGAPGATYTGANGVTYTWNDTYKSWQGEAGGASVAVGDTPPNVLNPSQNSEGDLWWNSSEDDGRLYVWYEEPDYNGGAGPGTAQWVPASPQGGGGTTYGAKNGVSLDPVDSAFQVDINVLVDRAL